MALNPSEKLKRIKKNIADSDALPPESKELMQEWVVAIDKRKTNHTADTEYAPGTVETYARSLRLLAVRSGVCLSELDADTFNGEIARLHDGNHPAFNQWDDDAAHTAQAEGAINPDEYPDGLNKSTCIRMQSAAKSFYRYHNLSIDPDDIDLYSYESDPKHDATDMFEDEEIEALRTACESPRNRALLELLIYTGQRITALQTLRIKDIELGEHGYIYLNDEVDGLKGATRRGRKRPMFGAKKYVADWLDHHPLSNDSEAYVFIGDLSHHQVDENDPDPIYQTTIRHNLKKIAKRAGVDKPVNPHNFVHYWVTIMYHKYGLDKDEMKALRGHSKGSNAIDTVYNHVLEQDYIESAEQKLGFREEQKDSPLTPETCPTCGRSVPEDARNCPYCGASFAPVAKDVRQAADGVQDDVTDAALSEDLSDEEKDGMQAVRETTEQPEQLAELLDGMEASKREQLMDLAKEGKIDMVLDLADSMN